MSAIYLAFADNCCKVHENRIKDNILFGVVIQDETQTISDDEISSGRVGVGVVADAVDPLSILNEEKISKTSTAATQTLQCCGFTARITIS
jgi:hypothetical protein